MTATPTPPVHVVSSDDTGYAAAAHPTSRIVLHSNKRITVTLDDGTDIMLRPPSVADWRQIRSAYLSAEAYITSRDTAEQDDALYGYDPAAEPNSGEGDPSDEQTSAPYADAFALVLRLLGSATIDSDALPLWATTGSVFNHLKGHWRRVEIVLAVPVEDTADTPPAGVGSVSDSAAPQPVPMDPTIPPDGRSMPVFDLRAAQAEHAAAAGPPPPTAAPGQPPGVPAPPPVGHPSQVGGIQGTGPGAARLQALPQT